MVYLESSQGCEPVQVWSLGPAHIVSSNQGHYKPWGKSKQMFKISQSAVEQTVTSIRNGDSDEFVKQFFASRPEWQEKDEKDEKKEDKQGTAQKA